MNSARSSEALDFSRRIDRMIITLTAGIVLGLIFLARGTTLPMFGANDRSRWATVYSLVEKGTYRIDETPWTPSIDRVQINGHTYSSKPPLLPTILGGEYWLLKKLSFGRLNLNDNAEAVIRTLVVSINLVPLIIFLVLYSRLLDKLAPDPWIRIYAMLAASLGTYLTAFCVTVNNHTIAAFAAFFALYPAMRIWCDGERRWSLFALAGFFAAFAGVNELPAASFLAALGAGLLWKWPGRTLRSFLPFALIPLTAHFATTYLVTDSWKPAYANKQSYVFEGSYWKVDPQSGRLVGSRVDPATGLLTLNVKDGIDNQYEPWPVYLFHLLIGHHGIFSLTPIFIFSFYGIYLWLGKRGDSFQVVAPLTAGLTAVLFVFYLFFAGQRNYGGMTNGLRWLFWLIPLWLLFLPLGMRGRSEQRGFRSLALAFLFVSVASTFYASRNPWTRPWLHQWLNYMGWIPY